MIELKLIDKIIVIPGYNRFLLTREHRPKIVTIKIPKELLTNDLNNSMVFLVSQLNENEVKSETLEVLHEENDYVLYKWDITNEHTFEEGKLTIQIRILRTEPSKEEATEDEIDSSFLKPFGTDAEGIWYSYQNYFRVLKSLQPLI